MCQCQFSTHSLSVGVLLAVSRGRLGLSLLAGEGLVIVLALRCPAASHQKETSLAGLEKTGKV